MAAPAAHSYRLGKRFWSEAPLLLTATIHAASGLVDSTVNDSEQRERDYLAAFRFYLRQPGVQHLVFVENSGADLSKFRALTESAGKNVELLSFDGNSFPSSYGKGYGEALLLDRALRESTLLAQAPAFIKTTGRLIVRNLQPLLESIDPDSAGHFDVRDHAIYARLGLRGTAHHADTRFFVVSQSLFSAHFRKRHESHRAGRFSLEANYLDALREAQRQGWRVRDRFTIEPIYAGTAGHGKNYDAPSEQIKRAVRQWSRRWFPGFKI